VHDHLDLPPDPRRAAVLLLRLAHPSLAAHPASAPSFHFSFPRPLHSTVLPPLAPTQALFRPSSVQIRSRLYHHAALFPSQFPGATIRFSVILIRNTHLRGHSFSFQPQLNSTRWNLLLPCPPPLSLTCQVDMSSSRAPPGVSLSLSSLPILCS
jgi:hypothetical protein